MNDYAKTHFSTKQSPSREDARLQAPDGDQKWSHGLKTASREGSETPDTGTLLKPNRRFSKASRLQNSDEFRRAYTSGVRYDGRFMTAFVLTNGIDQHRLGVTVSRKTSPRAVLRNRAKRLLREAFRLSTTEMKALLNSYDWVLNAKRSLFDVQAVEPLEEFQDIVARVLKDERFVSPSARLGSNEDGASGTT